jgi:RNA polymerase sigma factor (sigma-70 family)
LEVGTEVTADALAWAWENWDRVQAMANPVGYLFRVAQSSARRHHRWRRRIGLPAEPRDELAGIEPGLDGALAALPARQRTAVLLVHGLGWTYQETADAMDVSLAAVRNHVHRGLARLRTTLGERT